MGDTVGQIDLGLDINQKLFNKQMFGISKGAEKSVASAFGGLGKKIGVALGTAAIGAFVKSCLELGSDLAEVQNVVDVTFQQMNGSVNEFAKNAMEKFGLSETVTKKYMGTYGAMSKAFGFTEKQAYDMSETITGLTADVASFYNLGTDEAYTKMKSIWTGETESLKDLGVVMTQTALDQYALNNGFGKTTAKMTEQEKVMLRYQFVQSQLAAATGDFARTSDGWANQVRVLSLRFDSLKATLGQGFINLFTPIVRGINNVLASLDTLANNFVAFTELITGKSAASNSIGGVVSEMANSADNLTNSVGELGTTAAEAAKEATSGLAGFDKLNNLSEDNSASSGTSNGMGDLSSLTSGTGTMLGGVTVNPEIEKSISKIKDSIQPTIDALNRLKTEGLDKLKDFTFTALKDFYKQFLKPVGKWVLGEGLPDLIDAFNDFLKKIDFNKINKSLKRFWKAITPFATAIGQGIIDFYKDLLSVGADFINLVVPGALDGISSVLEGMDPKDIQSIAYSLTALATALSLYKGLTSIGSIIGGLAANIGLLCGLDFTNLSSLAFSLGTFGASLSAFHGWEFIADNIVEALDNAIRKVLGEDGYRIYNAIMEGLGGAFTGGLAGAGIGSLIPGLGTLAGAIIGGLLGAFGNIEIDGKSILKAMVEPIFNWDATLAVWEEAKKNFEAVFDGEGGIAGVAKNLILGLGKGLIAAAGFIVEPIGDFCVSVIDSVKEFFGIHSPSKVFADIGKDLGRGLINGIKSMFENIKEVFQSLYSKIKNVFANVKGWFTEKFSGAWEGIKAAFSLESVNEFFKGVWSNIKGCFGKVSNWFEKTFTKAWEAVKNVFSTGGKIFDGIKDGILEGLKAVVNALIGGINKVISVPFNGLNTALRKIKNIDILGVTPFNWISDISVPEIPKLAQGGYVEANTPQLAMIGDNRHHGEVVAPEDKLQSLLDKAVSAGGASKLEMLEIMALLRDILNVLKVIGDKDLIAYITSSELFRSLQKEAKAYTTKTGKPAF